MVFDLQSFGPLVNMLLILGGIGVSAIWLRSALVKQRHEELEDLAETRGHTIDDLRNEVEALRREVATIQGQLAALERLKIQEIADAVVNRLVSDTRFD